MMATSYKFRVWDEEFDKEIFTAEEIEASNQRIASIDMMIATRQEQGASHCDHKALKGSQS